MNPFLKLTSINLNTTSVYINMIIRTLTWQYQTSFRRSTYFTIIFYTEQSYIKLDQSHNPHRRLRSDRMTFPALRDIKIATHQSRSLNDVTENYTPRKNDIIHKLTVHCTHRKRTMNHSKFLKTRDRTASEIGFETNAKSTLFTEWFISVDGGSVGDLFVELYKKCGHFIVA